MRAPGSRLPLGFPVDLAPSTRRVGPRSLLGGQPRRVATLSEPAAAQLDRGSGRHVATAHDPTCGRLCEWLLDTGLGLPGHPLPVSETSAALTVVIPVRDRASALESLLRGLGSSLPVIVVDDGSRDPEQTHRLGQLYGAAVCQHPRNLGPAAARNTGLHSVQTPLVAFVDSDVTCTPGDLRRLARHFADPRVGLVAPRIVTPRIVTDRIVAAQNAAASQPDATWLARYEAAASSLDLGATPGLVRAGTAVPYVPSACVLMRVAACRNGFDPTLRVGEDVDLAWRLDDAGWLVRYDPSVRVPHQHRTRWLGWAHQRFRYGTSAARLANRHGPYVAPAVLGIWSVPVVLAMWGPASALLPVVVVGAVGVALTLRRQSEPMAGDRPAVISMALQSSGSALTQGAALATRHWWPLTLLLCLLSRRARRRATAIATLSAVVEYARRRPHLDPVRYLIARRLDDLAYGSGLWVGAARAGSLRALLPTTPAAMQRRRQLGPNRPLSPNDPQRTPAGTRLTSVPNPDGHVGPSGRGDPNGHVDSAGHPDANVGPNGRTDSTSQLDRARAEDCR